MHKILHFVRRPDVPARPVEEILSARERQVMEVLYRRRRATAAEIYEELPDAPSYNAVRGVLRILGEKGHVGHEREGRRYIYHPSSPAEAAGRSRLSRLSRTFFSGSAERVMSALFDEDPPDAAELERIERLIARTRNRQGGGGE